MSNAEANTLQEGNMYKRILILGALIMGFAAAPTCAQQEVAVASATKATFTLTVNPAILPCLQQSTKNAPTATVTLVKGNLNDTLTIKLKHVKPGLAFDLFTVQNSRFLSNSALDPAFANFGLAWYQSDIEVGKLGSGSAKIQTILVNQIFGFEDVSALGPTNTFHVGLWFNSTVDVVKCLGFEHPTPFNGDHSAGPLAMESVPNATTDLGPLCLNPTSGPPFGCNP
jgi:hypothetical protein